MTLNLEEDIFIYIKNIYITLIYDHNITTSIFKLMLQKQKWRTSMFRFKRKIAAFMAAVVILTTNLGVEMLPNSMKSVAEEHLIPVAAAASSSIKEQVNAGVGHSMAIKSDGTVSCWGDNTYGELGDGTKIVRKTPVNVNNIDNVVAASSQNDCSYVVKSDGTVWKWGKIEQFAPNGTPVKVEGLQDIVDIKVATNLNSASDIFYLALKSDGTVWTWGANSYGQLGIGSNINNYVPTQVPDLYNVTAIAAGGTHAVALKSDGTVWCWGGNTYGQLGTGTTTFSYFPVQVPGLSGVTAIAADGYHTLALINDGTVYGWGDGRAFGKSSNWTIPTPIEGFSEVSKIATGVYHCVVVNKDGTVKTLGKNDSGQGGINYATASTQAPTTVEGLSDIIDVSALNNYNLAVKSDGSVYGWGDNTSGLLGDGTNARSYVPVQVKGLNLFTTSQGAIEKVTINKTSITKIVGETERLLATVTPSSSADTGIIWSIQNNDGSDAVSLSDEGLVIASKPGQCVIRATSSADSEIYADCTVTVVDQVPATKLSLNKSSMAIDIGMSEQLTATIEPMNVPKQTIGWTVTSGSSIVSVANGRVTALKEGQAVIRAQIKEDPSLYSYCTVNVTKQTLIETTDLLNINEKESILGQIYPTQDYDYYKFTVSTTGTYRISSLSNPGDAFINADLYLYGSEGPYNSQGTENAYISKASTTFIQTLTAHQTYYIKIKMSQWNEVCAYKINIENVKLPVESISIAQKTVVLNINEIKQLQVSVSPSNAYNKEVTWSVPTESGIISVSSSGVVTALKAGTEVVRATSVSNTNVYTDCTIIVDDYGNTTTSAIAVKEDTLIPGEINPPRDNVGDSDYFVFTAEDTGWYKITVTTEASILSNIPTVRVYDANSKRVSSNPNYWENFNLVAGNKYYVEVEGLYSNDVGNYTLHIDSLTVHVTGINLPFENDTVQIEPGQSRYLLPSIIPGNATNMEVNWSLIDQSSSGTVTISAGGYLNAIKEGTAKLKVTSSENSSISKECNVVVKDYPSSTSAALDIQLNQVINGAVVIGDAGDCFKFTPSKSGVYKITSTNTSTDYYSKIYLSDSEKQIDYDYSYNTTAAVVTKELTAGSTYYIKVDRDSCEKCTYELKVECIVIPVESISFRGNRFVLEQGQTTQASITIWPEMVSNRNIVWTVPTGSGVIAVSTSGSIEALKPGRAIVRVTSEDNSNIYKDCDVIVTTIGDHGVDYKYPFSISDNTTVSGIIDPSGETDCFQFTASKNCYYRIGAKSDTTGSSITCKVYNENGFEYYPSENHGDYILMKLSSGNIYNILLEMSDSTQTGSYTFSVTPQITMDPLSNIEMSPGGTKNLTASVLPTNEDVSWSVVSGNEFVSISGNTLTAIKEGTAIVRATSVSDKTVYQQCLVTVDYGKDLDTAFEVQYNQTINGTFSSSTDADYYRFTLTTKGAVWLSISAESEDNEKINVTTYTDGFKRASDYNSIRDCYNPDTEYIVKVSPATTNYKEKKYVFKIGDLVDSVTISQNNADMVKGNTLKLGAVVAPSSAANTFVNWSVTSGISVVKVSSTGEVTALTAGRATVRATSRDTETTSYNKYDECYITVYDTDFIEVTDIDISQGLSIDLPRKLSEPMQLSATVYPDNATNKGVVWSIVSGSDYIYLNESTGVVTNSKTGKAVVRATSKSNPLIYKDIVVNILDDDYSNTKDLAFSLVQSKLTSGNIEKSGDCDYFKFVPSRTCGYGIEVDSSSIEGEVHLYDSDGKQIKYGTPWLRANLQANQTYFLEVRASNVQNKGAYNVSFSPFTDPIIEFSEGSIYMVPNQSKRIDYTVYTPDGIDREITWTVTSGSAIVSVSENGIVTSLAPGMAVVSAACSDSYGDTCNIYVYPDDHGSTTSYAITLSKNNVQLKLGDTLQLEATISPSAINKDFIWTVTSGSGIITLSENGMVTAIAPGTAVVRVASADDSSKYAECDITVEQGSTDPGTGDPGTGGGDPGTGDPGTGGGDPGTVDPGTGDGSGNASISIQNVSYHDADISVKIIFNGSLLEAIYNGDNKLVTDQDYKLSDLVYAEDGTTIVSAQCTIKSSYLEVLPKEQTTKLTFDFDKGSDCELSVSIPKLDECFIATAAFGSKFQPAVTFLRKFRDECLLTNWLGSKFVNFYYKYSPPIAQFIAGNEMLKGIVRVLLVPFIAVAYGIMHPVQGALGLIAIIFAAVLWRKRRRKLVNI